MSENDWEQIKAIVANALEEAPAERAAFVREACKGDSSLQAEVESLLAAHDSAPTFLDEVSPEHFAVSLEAQARDLEGSLLGPYRLDAFLARGGMGAVFRGTRVRDFEQVVAIKLLDAPGRTPEAVSRFLRERETLARLRHPNIAAILDGGTTADGVPYLVMEYVEGSDLLDYCKGQQLGIAARIQLMRQICAAVQEAHRKLIVHRDLKPANILVDRDGRPRLLDFGIAKALADEPAAGLTQGPLAWMTPEYASPEQVRGEEITIATDIYALGVIFYEMLAGEPPYRIKGTTRFQIEKEIVEAIPAAPSKAASGRPESRRKLHRDLDSIVLKCLSKDLNGRYSTVAALADDLERHVRGLPVVARPDSAVYRAGKFLKRNWLASSAAALLALSLLGGMIATSAESKRANRRAITAARATDLLVNAFVRANPESTPGAAPPSALAVLEESLKLLADDREIQNEPEVRRDLELGIGTALLGLHEDQRAFDTLTFALADHETAGGEPVVRARILFQLGIASRRLGKIEESKRRLNRAIELFRLHDESRLELLRAENAYAIALQQAGEREEARQQYATVESGYRSLLAGDHPSDAPVHFASTLSNLGSLSQLSGDSQSAIAYYEEAIELQIEALGPEHWRVATTLNNLGMLLLELQHWPESKECLQRALEIRRVVYPANHPSIAKSLNNLGYLMFEQGDVAASVPMFEEGLAMVAAVQGESHPEALMLRTNLAIVLQEIGRLADAEVELREVLRLRQSTLEPDHADVGFSLLLLGQNLWSLGGDAERAEPILAEAVRIYTLVADENGWDLNDSRFLHAQTLAALNRAAEARDELAAAIEFYEANGAPELADAARALLP